MPDESSLSADARETRDRRRVLRFALANIDSSVTRWAWIANAFKPSIDLFMAGGQTDERLHLEANIAWKAQQGLDAHRMAVDDPKYAGDAGVAKAEEAARLLHMARWYCLEWLRLYGS